MVSTAEAWAVCHTCRLRHPCWTRQGYDDFCQRHVGHATSYLNRDMLHERFRSPLAAWDPRKVVRSAFGHIAALALRAAFDHNLDLYAPNADVKEAFQSVQTLTTTSLQSLSSSPTAGWQSAGIDNASNLYLDDLFQFTFAYANTAPASSKCAYLFAAHSLDGGTTWTKPATGSEGSITLVDVTANPQALRMLGTQPYTTANETTASSALSMAATAGGVLPSRYAAVVINHTGAATNSSGNVVKHQGVYSTVI